MPIIGDSILRTIVDFHIPCGAALWRYHRSMSLTIATGEWPPARWVWWLPRLTFALFVAVVAALLWHAERSDREERRATLLSDVLWLEQNTAFLLGHNEELLARLDPAAWATPAQFEAHALSLVGNNSGLRQVYWFSPDGELRRAAPRPIQAVGEQPLREVTRTQAASMGRATYGAPWQEGGNWLVDLVVPIFRGGRLVGMAVAEYSLSRLIEDAVPWWLTERYRIAIVDADGHPLAQRSKVGEPLVEEGYQVPFEPPGHGLALRATPYHQPTPLAGRLLPAALVVLALLVLASFWALRRHVQGRLAAETALRGEFAFRTAMEDSLHTGLRARDLTGRVTYVNPAFCRMVGYERDELVGRTPPMPYWADEYLAETQAMHQRVLSGQSPSEGFEVTFRRKSGDLFDALIHEAPLIDAQGRHTGWMGSVVDITERKRAQETERAHQERLQASSRLVTMGEMASSLAHELNQPLAAITSYLAGSRNLLATQPSAPALADIDGALAKCQEQAQRAGRIIRRIYEFMRRHEARHEVVDLAALLTDLVGLLDVDARRLGVRVQLTVPDAPVAIDGDGVLLGQAVLNLMRNGIDAMRSTPDGERELSVALVREADALRIDVADRGAGISPEVAAHLFEPFYTTKQEGLGVGLNICRSVVEAHHGRLWHEPNPGGGSVFRIRLPLVEPAAP